MNESTTITIDNIAKLIKGIAEAEYQRGYVAGLEEKRLTDKYWGKDKEDKTELNNIIKNAHGSIENRINAAYNLGKKDGMSKWIPVKERLPEDRRVVLVTAYWHETYQVMMASYYGDGLWWCVPYNNCGEHMQRLNPKAWTPLPEPYREDGETDEG